MRSVNRQLARVGTLGTAVLLTAAVAGCDSLLDVNLPAAVTEAAVSTPSTAALQVNSVVAGIECGYSKFSLVAAGFEDNFQRNSGSAGSYEEYQTTPSTGDCYTSDNYSSTWFAAVITARAQGETAWDALSKWTDAEVPNRNKLMAEDAIYVAIAYDIFGEYFCDMAVNAGKLITPDQTLDLADQWVGKALDQIAKTGDFAITVAQGQVTSSAKTLALGLRARILWAKAGVQQGAARAATLKAAADAAAQVPDGFTAWILRDAGDGRMNNVASMQGNGGGVQAGGFLQGPVRLKNTSHPVPYGVSVLGTNPVTGQAWPNPVPFTGYIDLAILPNGRAVDASGYPITTATTGAIADSRVQYKIGNTAGGPQPVEQKYKSLADDIPLVNWQEMRLIQAQYQNEIGNTQAAVALINQLRTAAGLPNISADYAASLDQLSAKYAIIEERRRALWLEGRFWSTKIQNTDVLWFPRNQGDWVNSSATYSLQGGVRLLLPQDEYEINPNLGLAARGTGCPVNQRPVFQ